MKKNQKNNKKSNNILMAISASIVCLSVSVNANNVTDALDKKIGQVFTIGFDGTTVSKEFCKEISDYDLGGVILYDKNIINPKQVKKLTQDLQKCSPRNNLLIAIDQEGGKVQRLKSKYGFYGKFKSASEVSEMSFSDIKNHYKAMAIELKKAGINYNLAPVVDLNLNKENQIIAKYGRSYGSVPKEVSVISKIFIEEHNEQNVSTSLKHFPGHGSSFGDTHKGFVDVTKEWTQKELKPFVHLKKYADSVMMAHVYNKRIDEGYPASLSKKTITEILREKIGFKGVVISDDMQMGAIAKKYFPRYIMKMAMLAGTDNMIFGNQVEKEHRISLTSLVKKLKQYYTNGDITEKSLDKSISRLNRMKSNIGIMKKINKSKNKYTKNEINTYGGLL